MDANAGSETVLASAIPVSDFSKKPRRESFRFSVISEIVFGSYAMYRLP
jgi:hypothetical protein